MRFFIYFVLLLVSVSLSGQTKKELAYKPKNMDEALLQLDIIIPDHTIKEIKSITEEEFLLKTHFTTGLWIRNEWLYDKYLFGLFVRPSDLKGSMEIEKTISDDDLSSIILRSYYRKQNNKEILLERQINDIYDYYSNMDNPGWLQKQDSIYWSDLMKQYQVGDTLTKHVSYKKNWIFRSRGTTLVKAVVIQKTDRLLKINIISFGDEMDEKLIYKEIKCDADDCWINPNLWNKGKK